MAAISESGRTRVRAVSVSGVALALLVGLVPAAADGSGYQDPASRAVKVVAGTAHTCVLTDEGAVRCWGYNQDGQVNVPTGLGSVTDLAVGWYHTCALTDAPGVSCWGWNGLRQLDVPARVQTPQSVYAGYATSCALNADAVLQCWGAVLNRNEPGYKPWQGGDASIVAAAVSANHGCALVEGGGVNCWGSNASGESNVPADLGAATAVSVGAAHSCALLEDATLRCWGGNTYGQTSVPAGLEDVTLISAGGRHTCALAAGTVRCWGANDYGQSTVPSGLDDVVSLSAGGLHTCAATASGAVSCWGSVAFKDGSAASAVPADFIPWPTDFPEDTNPAPAGALQVLGDQVVAVGAPVRIYAAYGRAGQTMNLGASGLAGRSVAADAIGYGRFTSTFATTGKKTVTVKAKMAGTTRSASMTVWVPKVPATARVRAGKTVNVSISALPPGADVSLTADTGEEFSATASASGSVRVPLSFADAGVRTVTVSTADTNLGDITVTVS